MWTSLLSRIFCQEVVVPAEMTKSSCFKSFLVAVNCRLVSNIKQEKLKHQQNIHYGTSSIDICEQSGLSFPLDSNSVKKFRFEMQRQYQNSPCEKYLRNGPLWLHQYANILLCNHRQNQSCSQVCRHYCKVPIPLHSLKLFNNKFSSTEINFKRYIKRKHYQFPEIKEEDISEDFQRGDGPGGQAVAKTSNCVVLKHHPTGIVIKCHATRSLEKNRAIARERLKEQLDVLQHGEESFLSLERKEGVIHRAKKLERSKKRLEMKRAWKESLKEE